MNPFSITLSLTIIVLIGYALVGVFHYQKEKTILSYFLNGRHLDKSHIRNTFAGAAISIATVLVFFFTIGFQFGMQILWSPITLAVGVIFFKYIILPSLVKKGFIQSSTTKKTALRIDSLSDLIYKLYGSKVLATTVTLISGLGILAILVAEMMVGVSILSIEKLDPIYILLLISTVLFIYAGFGGLQSVVVTDRWQIMIVIVSLFLVLLYSTFNLFGLSSVLVKEVFTFSWEQKIPMPLSLIVNIIIVNVCLLPSSLRVWQVVAASESSEKFGKALWESTFIILYASICALLIGKTVQLQLESPNMTIDALFQYLLTSSFFSGHILFPLFAVALVSALVSTADSAILPLAQSIHVSISKKFNQKLNLLIIGGLLLICILSYYLITLVLNMGVVNWILTVFSITTVIAPVILYPLFLPKRTLSKSGEILMSIGVLAACLTALYWSVGYAQDLSTQPWNCALGVGISLSITIISTHFFSHELVSNQ